MWGCERQELHEDGVVENVRGLVGGRCCFCGDGGGVGDCRPLGNLCSLAIVTKLCL